MSARTLDELTFLDRVLASQVGRIIVIALGALGVWVISLFWPQFFDYRYFYISDNLVGDVARFWPAFAWCAGLTVLVAFTGRFRSSWSDEAVYGRGLLVSLGAGVTEEAWYRWVGVCYSMIGLIVLNWLYETVGWLFIGVGALACVLIVISFFIEEGRRTSVAARVFTLAVSGTSVWALVTYGDDPLYNLYEHAFYPVISTLSFGLMDGIFTSNHQPFLVMGMFAANFAFRDGHKYQGFFGWSNSWWMGCVFIYATLTYGLAVAVTVHALYDLLIFTLEYLARKVAGS